MMWLEEKLNIDGIPDGHMATITGTLVHGIVQINVEWHDTDDNSSSIIEWAKAIPIYNDDPPISYDDIRQKYWNQVIKVKAKHEAMPYPMWREYMAMKIDGMSRL